METQPPRSAFSKAPPFCKWTMVVALYGPVGAPQIKVTMVTQTGGIISQKEEENGRRQESCRIGPLEYKTTAGSEEGEFLPPGTLAMEDGTFPELAWVNQRFLLGSMNVQNQRCDVYADIHGKPIPTAGDPTQKLTELLKNESMPGSSKSKLQPGIVPPAFLADGIRIACLNAQTHLPVLLQNGFEVRSYAFTSLPNQGQQLPKKVQERKAAIESANKAVFSPYARP